ENLVVLGEMSFPPGFDAAISMTEAGDGSGIFFTALLTDGSGVVAHQLINGGIGIDYAAAQLGEIILVPSQAELYWVEIAQGALGRSSASSFAASEVQVSTPGLRGLTSGADGSIYLAANGGSTSSTTIVAYEPSTNLFSSYQVTGGVAELA